MLPRYFDLLISLSIFFITLALVIFRPYRLGIGIYAMAGGAITLILGLVTLKELELIWEITWNSTFTFVAIIIFSMVLEESGFFAYMGIKIASAARNSRSSLFLILCVFTAVIAAFFANDGAILVMTPVTFLMLSSMGFKNEEMMPYLISVSFISDIGSSPFMISNLVNIIGSSYFSISFTAYAVVMILPDIGAVVISIAILYMIFRKDLIGTFVPAAKPDGTLIVRDRAIFYLAIPFTVALMITYSVTGIYNVPVAFVAVPAVAGLFAFAWMRKRIDAKKILVEAPWQVVIFAFGIFIVVFGVGSSGVVGYISGVLLAIAKFQEPLSLILEGIFIVPFTSVMNNLPATMLTSLAVGSSHLSSGYVYELILANDIGTKMSPIGSLATLLWIHNLSVRHGIAISAKEYMRLGLLVCIPALIVASLFLYFSLIL